MGVSPNHEPTPTEHGTDAHSNYPLTAHRGNRARCPLEGSTTYLTPLPCERATMVIIKSRVFIWSPLIGPGLGGSSHHDHPDGRRTNSPKVAPPKKRPTYPNILGQRDASPQRGSPMPAETNARRATLLCVFNPSTSVRTPAGLWGLTPTGALVHPRRKNANDQTG
jgi:hypothetical protein